MRLLVCTLILLILSANSPAIKAVDNAVDLVQVAKNAQQNGKIHILYFSASYCSYCETLQDQVINALMSNQNYQQKVVVTELKIDGKKIFRGFNHKWTDAETISERFDIEITPTLVFLDDSGKEIAERRVGYQQPDFYWYYLDESINEALASIPKG